MKNKLNLIFIFLFCVTVHAQRDPTRPPGISKTYSANNNIRKLDLQGIISGDNPWVIINDSVFHVGDDKNGIRVINIRKNRVQISQQGTKKWLLLDTAKIKQFSKKSSK